MKLQRTLFIGITGVFFAIGVAGSQASAECEPMMIEVNALRGGSPTVTVGEFETKNITAKARILKGTAEPGTTIETTLEITAADADGVFNTTTSFPHVLEIGRGGKGRTIAMPTFICNGGFIEFAARFYGYDGDVLCVSETKMITKTCKEPRN